MLSSRESFSYRYGLLTNRIEKPRWVLLSVKVIGRPGLSTSVFCSALWAQLAFAMWAVDTSEGSAIVVDVGRNTHRRGGAGEKNFKQC